MIRLLLVVAALALAIYLIGQGLAADPPRDPSRPVTPEETR